MGAGLAAGACLSAGALRLYSYDVKGPLGFQVHGLAQQIAKDFAGTLRLMAGMKYKAVELVSFPGFGPRFASLAALKPAEIRQIIADAGMTAPSSHFLTEELLGENLNRVADWANGVGIKYVVETNRAKVRTNLSKSDWQPILDRINRTGEQLRKAGLQLGLHTTPEIFLTNEDVPALDQFVKNVPATNCLLEMDVSATHRASVLAGEAMAKYPGRFFALHLRDAKRRPDITEELPPLPLGQGEVDLKEALVGAKKGRVKYYIMEMEVRPPADPVEAFKISAEYLRNLKI